MTNRCGEFGDADFIFCLQVACDALPIRVLLPGGRSP
jgi:hypothetical protein